MERIPISIEKIKVESHSKRKIDTEDENCEIENYLLRIDENGQQWEKTFICDRDLLLDLRNRINKLIEPTTTAKVLRLSTYNAKIVDEHYTTDMLCEKCSYKLTKKCYTCLFELESPLERKLFLELSKADVSFVTQYALSWKGKPILIMGRHYKNPTNNFKDVLTVVDFYIEKDNTKLCVYTDGHTYHERTEEQAQRDRNIDRRLQEFGFKVLRYTGKDVNESVFNIVRDIIRWTK